MYFKYPKAMFQKKCRSPFNQACPYQGVNNQTCCVSVSRLVHIGKQYEEIVPFRFRFNEKVRRISTQKFFVFLNISFMKPAIVSKSCRKEKLMRNGDFSATPPHLLQISLRAISASEGRHVQVDLSQKVDGQSTMQLLVLCSAQIVFL